MSTGNRGLSPGWGAYYVTLAKPPSSFWASGFASMDNRIGLEQSNLFQCSDSYQSDLLSTKGRNTLFFLSSWVNYPLNWHKPGFFLFGLAYSAELWMNLWEQNHCALKMLWKGRMWLLNWIFRPEVYTNKYLFVRAEHGQMLSFLILAGWKWVKFLLWILLSTRNERI